MDEKTRQILKDARHTILWLCNPQLRIPGEGRLPRTDIVEAIDAVLEIQPSPLDHSGHKDYCTKDRCYCGSQ